MIPLEPESNEPYVICPTTGRKLNPNTLIPIEDSVDFSNWTLGGVSTEICDCCGAKGARTHRQRTHYQDDDNNIVTLCDYCEVENAKYWDDMWTDYYNGCL